jgi:hypothetical protein
MRRRKTIRTEPWQRDSAAAQARNVLMIMPRGEPLAPGWRVRSALRVV